MNYWQQSGLCWMLTRSCAIRKTFNFAKTLICLRSYTPVSVWNFLKNFNCRVSNQKSYTWVSMANEQKHWKTQLPSLASSVDSIIDDERLKVSKKLYCGCPHPLERTGNNRARYCRRITPHNHTPHIHIPHNQQPKQNGGQADHVRLTEASTITSGLTTTSANHASHSRSTHKVAFILADGDVQQDSRSIRIGLSLRSRHSPTDHRRVTVLRDCREHSQCRITSVTAAAKVIGLSRTAAVADSLTTDGYIDQCIRRAEDSLFHVDPIPKGSTTFAAALRAMKSLADEANGTEHPGTRDGRTTEQCKSRVRHKPSSTSKVAYACLRKELRM